MADEPGPQGAAPPMPTFNFMLDLGDGRPQPFAEVSGLGESPAVEYRHSDRPVFSAIKMPGLGGLGNVTLKRGILARESILWDWFALTTAGSIERRTISIALLNESGAPTMRWTLAEAWPTNLVCGDLRSDDNEIAVELLEFAFDTLSVQAGSGDAAG